MILRDFPLYLMETLKCRHSLHGCIVVFMFLTMISEGSTCEAPSSPQCFRTKAIDSIYTCEWSMNTTESDMTFDLYLGEKHFGNIKKNQCELNEELLIKHRQIFIWVEAHVGNSSCSSTRRSVILAHTVKYEAPKNISLFWLTNKLHLSWPAAEMYPALAEVRFRRHEHPTELWENKTTNTTIEGLMYQVAVVNLLKDSAYQVQIRHRSNQAKNPLWSQWSSVAIVPAELEHEPEVTMTTRPVNSTRKVMLTWKPMPHAAAVTGVTYSLNDTQSSRGCPCVERRRDIKTNKHTTYISYSAVNISVFARNSAGRSPLAIIQVPAASPADIKSCNKTLLDKKLTKRTCLELYEFQDGDSRPKKVITLSGRMKKKERERIRNTTEDYVRYLYFEHRCDNGIPRTLKMCLFYEKEGAPSEKPEAFVASGQTHSSVELSWKAIPIVHQQGFLTHYRICSVKLSSQDEPKGECNNIPASAIKYRLENLTPESKYNISLAGVTRVGEGPQVTITIKTLSEKLVNVSWSFSLLFVFFIFSTSCTFILKRIKIKIFPPVPIPVIPDFTPYQPESQEMLERKEEVHELTLHQLLPEVKSVPEDAEEDCTVLGGEWDDLTDEDMEDERGDSRMSGGSSDEPLSPSPTDKAMKSSKEGELTDLEQVDNEIAMLIYRNGLVFDVKTD